VKLIKKIFKAFVDFVKPKPQEISLEQFIEMESKKIIKKPINKRNYYEFYDL